MRFGFVFLGMSRRIATVTGTAGSSIARETPKMATCARLYALTRGAAFLEVDTGVK